MLRFSCRRPHRLITEQVLYKEFAFVAIPKQWDLRPSSIKDANVLHMRLIYTVFLALQNS
jgi:hypothetical protein